MSARIVSGSSCSPRTVEPVTSANRTVTIFRTSRVAGAAGVASGGGAQAEQKRAPSGFSARQAGHAAITALFADPDRLADPPCNAGSASATVRYVAAFSVHGAPGGSGLG